MSKNMLLVSGLLSQCVWAGEGTQNTLLSYIQQGGWIMYVLMFLSVIMVALVFYYLVALRKGVWGSDEFVQKVEALETASVPADALTVLCSEEKSLLSEMALLGCKEAGKVGAGHEKVEGVCREFVESQQEATMNHLDYLNDIADVAPMFGLLGTVIGMMVAFSNTQANIDGLQIDSLASGVTQALVTTAAGLILAVVAKILYSLFKAKANVVFADFSHKAGLVVEAINKLNIKSR